MRLGIMLVIVIAAINVAVDIYIWRRLTAVCRRRWPGVVYAWSSLLLLVYIITVACLPRRGGSDGMLIVIMWMLYAYVTVYLPKYIYCIFSLFDYLPLVFRRRKCYVGSVAGIIAAIGAFVVLWWAALVNRTDYKVNYVELEFDNLPAAFDDYVIVQFSDFHLGTYGSDTTFVSRVVDEINSRNADVVLFTGDIVNRRSDEMLPHVPVLSRLQARDGVYSVLGNHDYGDYSSWKNDGDKAENMKLLRTLQRNMGWNELDNATAWLRHEGDSIALIGVENWGDPPFPVYGDLAKAYPQLSDSVFKVLMTHNPAHWVNKIADNDTVNIDLTLSGHTHAMQMQIARWSPAAWRYSKWGGLYGDKSDRHKLYVNIGLGTVALPARIGATPEITVLKLKKKAPNTK
ncbi:MAG: metallophosphoesterase [Muribaculum sp.]